MGNRKYDFERRNPKCKYIDFVLTIRWSLASSTNFVVVKAKKGNSNGNGKVKHKKLS